MQFEITFADLEAQLAEVHDIAPNRRTAFQARLKNFHRLGFPAGFKMTRGRPAIYTAGEAAQMALAIELTQLGLTPERIASTLAIEWFPTMMALRLAARDLLERPDGFDPEGEGDEAPPSMFIFFDPSALASLSAPKSLWKRAGDDQLARSYFYGGDGIVRENIVRWTTGEVPRVSLVNVTAMLDQFAGELADPEETRPWRLSFFQGVVDWSLALEDAEGNAIEAGRYVFDFTGKMFTPAAIDRIKPRRFVEQIAAMTGILPARVEAAMVEGVFEAGRMAGIYPVTQPKDGGDDGDS